MIKINLTPLSKKKKKKSKPVPAFLASTIGITVAVGLVLGYLVYFFNSRYSMKQQQFNENEKTIAELKEKIKAVEDFEKRNAAFQKRKEIIEQLGRNKTVPVKIIDELSALLPPGVWIISMDKKGADINISCMAFTNTDVVNYVNNLKGSKIITDVFLQESILSKVSEYSLYAFKMNMKVKT